MNQRFDYGTAVRVIRNVRNDGTFPGAKTGDLLIRRGSVGHVRDIGTFLQDQVIYTVHFLDADRIVGCRAEELIPAEAPWVTSRFETREFVRTRMALALHGQVVVEAGSEGEVLRVLRDTGEEVNYHVLFPPGVFVVPERALVETDA